MTKVNIYLETKYISFYILKNFRNIACRNIEVSKVLKNTKVLILMTVIIKRLQIYGLSNVFQIVWQLSYLKESEDATGTKIARFERLKLL